MIRTGLATDDAHRGPVEAIGATLPGASWQRCRTHYAANLMSATPKSAADTDATPQPHGSRCPRAAREVNRTPWLDTRKLDTRKEAARQSARYLLTQVESPP
jgi:transposase-like protein